MQLQSLKHILAVVQAMATPEKIYLFGSACLLPGHPQLGEPGQPLALTQDADVLVQPIDDALASALLEALGKEASFMQRFGYYADILRPSFVETLPQGWESRLMQLSGYENVFALDPYDLALVKLVLGREKDLELLRGLLRLGIIEAERLRQHYQQAPLQEREAFAASRNLHKLLAEGGAS
jgi:hypothetical protein